MRNRRVFCITAAAISSIEAQCSISYLGADTFRAVRYFGKLQTGDPLTPEPPTSLVLFQKGVAASSRLALALIGLCIVVVAIPHYTPWDMTDFARTVRGHQLVFRLRFPFFSTPFYVSTRYLLLGIGILVFLVVASFPPGRLRAIWTSLLAHRGAFMSGMIASYVFFLTLTPSEPHFVSKGPAVVLYLIFSSVGLAMMFAGLRPFLRSAFDHPRIGAGIEFCYLSLRRIVIDSPLLLFLGVLVLAEFLLTNLFSLLLFQHIPHIQDSIAQMFHGMIFANGALTAPAPPLPEFFNTIHVIIQDGKWYSQYPPGHSVLLALGYLAGAPWIINPLFAALTVVAMYFLGKELHGPVVGRMSALLTFLSPFVLFMSSEYMNHTTAMFFFVCFLVFFARALRTGRFLDGALAGAALGYYADIRPYSAAAIAFPFLLYGLLQLRKRWPELRHAAAGLIVFLALLIGALLVFNDLTNGSPFVFGFQALWGSKVNPGFGHSAWGVAHTPLQGFLQTLSNFNGINKYLFELPVPSLLFATLLFFSETRNRWDFLFAGGFLALAAAYFLYWFQDWCFGPRFLFESAALLIVLTARGIELFPSMVTGVFGIETSRHRIRLGSTAAIILFFALGFATNIRPHLEFYGNSYWGVNADLINTVRAKGLTKAIVFVQGNYSSGFVGNDPFLRQGVLYVHNHDADNVEMMNAHPGYRYFVGSGTMLEEISAATYEQTRGAGVSEHSTSTTPQEPEPRPSR